MMVCHVLTMEHVASYIFCHEQLRYVFYHEKREVIEERMEERARNFWLDDHTAFLDIQTLSYNAHQVP